MIITTDILVKKFNKFNRRFFNSALPVIDIIVTREKNRFGAFEYMRQYDYHLGRTIEVPRKISISSYYDMDEKFIDETLIHEMIHYYIAYRKIKDNDSHGYYFMAYANRISESSEYSITAHGSAKGLIPANYKKKDYYIVTFKYMGESYFSRISKSRVGSAEYIMENFAHVTDITFYKSDDVRLDIYRQCTARLSLNSMNKLTGIDLIKIS